MRNISAFVICGIIVLVTIVAFGHWEQQEGPRPLPAPRFTDNGDGTVTDNTSGLIWLKDANCFGRLNWHQAERSVAALANDQCGLMDASAAGDWRLPEKTELLPLISELYQEQWMEENPFSGVQPSPYWSETLCESYPDAAWLVFFNLYYGRVDYDRKTRPHYVWPVRDGQ